MTDHHHPIVITPSPVEQAVDRLVFGNIAPIDSGERRLSRLGLGTYIAVVLAAIAMAAYLFGASRG